MVRVTKKTKTSKKPTTADEYFAGHTGVVRDVLMALRSLVKTTLPKATEGFKWGAPSDNGLLHAPYTSYG